MFHPLSLFSRRHSVPARREDVPADPFFRLHQEMNRLFDEAFAGFGGAFAAPAGFGEASPRVDIRETDGALVVEAELPGVAEDDLDVELSDNVLTIRGEKKSETRDERSGAYRYVERSYGAFSRAIPIPYDIDPDAVEAKFKNGVLTLTLPKPEGAARASRKIAIKRG